MHVPRLAARLDHQRAAGRRRAACRAGSGRREHRAAPSRFAIVDDFLGPQEYREILALALAAEAEFKAGASPPTIPSTHKKSS